MCYGLCGRQLAFFNMPGKLSGLLWVVNLVIVHLPPNNWFLTVSTVILFMIIVLSPSKTQDFSGPAYTQSFSQPALLPQAEELMGTLRNKSQAAIAKLMDLSESLATLNHERFQQWQTPFAPNNARQALLAFKGDVYTGFDLESYQQADFDFAQDHIRILSGLYGVLRPLDLIQPYRLEMGTPLKTPNAKDLYRFWGQRIAQALNNDLAQQPERVLINLASNEYFKAIDTKALEATIITPWFQEEKPKGLQTIGYYAKRARGMMAQFIVQNHITSVQDLKGFDMDGYLFNEQASTNTKWVFSRPSIN